MPDHPSSDRITLRVHPHRRWLGVPVPFQSWAQSLSALACTLVGTGLVLAVIALLRGLPPPDVIRAMLLCSAVCVLPVVNTTRASTLVIRTDPQGEAFWRQRLQDRLEFHGYRHVEHGEGGRVRYRTLLPRLLRWDENEFVVERSTADGRDAIVATGPAMVARLMHRALQR